MFQKRIIILIILFFPTIEKGILLGTTIGDNFHRFGFVYSYFNFHYRFYQNHPSVYDLILEIDIPYLKNQENFSSTNTSFLELPMSSYQLKTLFSYALIDRLGKLRHRYFVGQSWYGDFLHVESGYGYTHRVNPITSYRHEWLISLGGYVNNWEFKTYGTLNWYNSSAGTSLLPLFGGVISYFFYSSLPTSSSYFPNNPKTTPSIPHRIDLSLYQTSFKNLGIKNSFQFTLRNSPHAQMSFSWEIFPFRIGVAFQFALSNIFQVVSHTQYHPEQGFNQSIKVGAKNYRFSYYRNQLSKNLSIEKTLINPYPNSDNHENNNTP